ncbi:uncharacterized protein LOC107365735 [Tetranychus urticae]|uniref:uncharacterized protein LOC107365735 n=1 Tax=Tetranychus urticae TaxID=32264 RepID=UPI000D6551B0|nr:uncharacterized protein LOC107365735 [Tetranychus urticae]
MLIKLLIVFTLFTTISTISTHSLVDLPLKVPNGGPVINATLTDVNGFKKYFIQELISASGKSIKGKILISDDKDSYSVHYKADSQTGVDSKERLVIHGTNCLLFTYKNGWDKTLPGIDNSLLNLILLMGPSILYRLDHSSFVWKSVADKNIRGIMMKGASTEVNEHLKIIFYYKSHLDYQSGIENPSRIEFSGYDRTSVPYPGKENLYLDIYSIPHTDTYSGVDISSDLVQSEVHPPLGIGCPHYLSGNEPLPSLLVTHLHFTMEERIQGSTASRSISKVYAEKNIDFLRIKAVLLGSEVIYDYRLGVSFHVGTNGSIAVVSIDSNTPGLDRALFSLDNLFMLDLNFKYLGRLKLEHRFGIPAEAWESVQYNVNINGKKVDKAVVTQFFVSSQNDAADDIFDGYTLVSTKISIYDYDISKKVYTWRNGITRDYMNFQQVRSIENIRSLTEKVKYASSDEKVILNFVLECDASDRSYNKCIKHTEDRVYWLKADFLYFVLLVKPVSILRISDIEYRFTDTKIEMEVTFLDLPHLEFNSKTMSLSEETFDKMMKTKANNEPECLEKLSQFSQETIKVVIYRPSDLVCGYLSNPNDLKEDTKQGQSASVYFFPLNNLYRVKQELTLDQIHDAYLQDVGMKFHVFDRSYLTRLKIIDVIDKTKKEIDSKNDITSQIRQNAKLRIDNQFTFSVPDGKNFADCYRNCHESDQVPCITFSFCNNDGKIDCRVSSLQASDVANKDQSVETDLKCEIYSISILQDYSRKSNRKFKTQQSTAVEQDSVHSCAKACHASSECISFQYCDGSCTFGDLLYTDEATEYDEECMIYTPKVSERYQKTGNKIVSDVMMTETKLTLDQCASLCYELSDGEETGCKSFNYCPKSRSESSCSLTHFSVKGPDTKTTDGGHCYNYELKVESNGNKRKESSSTKEIEGTTGSGAFGIIILFLFVGAALGFMAPFAYSKVKQIHDASKTNADCTWKRQQDEQPIENVY